MTLAMAKYFGLFVTEATEHLAAMTADLVRLEEAARAGVGTLPGIDELFRHVHSVKGMAASLELDGIATVAHRAEDLVGAFRGGRTPDAAAIDVLLETADALTAMIEHVRAGKSPEAAPALLERLGAALAPVPRTVRCVVAKVRIAAACPVPAVRGFLVLKRLERLGEVVAAKPPPPDVRAGRMEGTEIEVTLATTAALGDVEATLGQISDLESVAVAEQHVDRSSLDDGRAGLRPGRAEVGSLAAAASGGSAVRPQPVAGRTAATREAGSGRTVRVRTELLDDFLDSVGELIVSTARLREIGRGLPEEHRPVLDEGVDRLHATVKVLHDQVMAVRMTPLASATGRLPRAVRDVARRTGKQVEVEIRGADIEIDRAILDDLADPLLHVIRNAVDHGIETPEERQRSGKPPAGHVRVAAHRDRERVVVEIADDGKGMDPGRLRRAAVAHGSITEEAAQALDDRQALMLACVPGVSTANAVSDVSGRGVGMDAVKRTVDALGGTLEVESAPGQGTRWIFRLPATMVVQPVLLVSVRGEVLGLPVAKVHGAMQAEPVTGAIEVDGRPVPLRDLGELLGFGRAGASALSSIVIAEEQGRRVGFVVDALLGQQDVVLKPLLRPFDEVPGLSAVTVLANGRPLFVLDVLDLAA